MGRDTLIAQKLKIYEGKARYDAAAKKILQDKQVVAWILKGCVREYVDCSFQDIQKYLDAASFSAGVVLDSDETIPSLLGLQNEDALLYEGKVLFDSLAFLRTPITGGNIGIILDVEAQNIQREQSKYPIITRGIYYCGRLISFQKNVFFKDSEYGKLNKVYSIWICTEPAKDKRRSIVEYTLGENVIYGNARADEKMYDLIVLTMIYLGIGEQQKDQQGMIEFNTVENRNDMEKLLDVFELLFTSRLSAEVRIEKLEKQYGFQMTEEIQEGVTEMCNLSEGWIEIGRIEGREKGREEGRVEGREEGRVEGRASIIKHIMQKQGWTLEATLQWLEITESQINEIYEMGYTF